MTTWQVITTFSPSLAQGLLVTIEMTVIGTAAALVIGILGAVARLFGNAWLRGIASTYVEIIRGTPQILQLFIIFFGLMQFGINLSPFISVALWLALYGGAYATELFRAGIMSVDSRQREAATAIGLNPSTTLRKIILPQAVAVIIPALISFLVLQLKASSLAFTIGAMDIMSQAKTSATSHSVPLYLMVAVGYLILNIPLGRLGVLLERRTRLYQ